MSTPHFVETEANPHHHDVETTLPSESADTFFVSRRPQVAVRNRVLSGCRGQTGCSHPFWIFTIILKVPRSGVDDEQWSLSQHRHHS